MRIPTTASIKHEHAKISIKTQSWITPLPSRRLFSFTLFTSAPIILDAVANEARLWKQELELAGRRSSERLSTLFPSAPSSPSKPKKTQSLDAEFALELLISILTAAGEDAKAVRSDAKILESRELEYFKQNDQCGHCGDVQGPSSLKDRDYFDFLSYVYLKAFLLHRPLNDDNNNNTTSINQLRLAIGDALFGHILSDVDVGEAEAVGISPYRAFGGSAAALVDVLSASAELDSVRLGVRAILDYFKSKGFISHYYLTQFGISTDEYENHSVWARGEPAYLKYWLDAPADQRSITAMQSETNGACFSFIGATITAYLHRCGVETEGLVRNASLQSDRVWSEQATVRRKKAISSARGGSKSGGYKEWRPDQCPPNMYTTTTDDSSSPAPGVGCV